MGEPIRQPSLHYYQGADRPTLLFRFDDLAGLQALKAVFLSLARCDVTRVSLKETRVINALDRVCLAKQSEPSRMVAKISTTIHGPVFEFRRHSEGCLDCAELLDGLLGPGHQYLSHGNSDEALIMISFQESQANTGRKYYLLFIRH